MRIVDLSQPIHTGMQVFPGDPAVSVNTVATVAEDGYQVASLHAGSHTGTHLDAPLHSVVDGESVDAIDLRRLVGAARIVDCTEVGAHDVVPWAAVESQLERLEGIAMVLFRTGWSEHFGDQRYLQHPVLDAEIATRLLEAGVTVMGVDSLNPDPTLDNEGLLPFHAIFLGAGGVIVENLTNLAAVTWDDPLVSVLPLPLAGGDGAPVRAVALELDVPTR
ncbi:cyclase family protein [uncultured Arthrobacter sp.]|uniref:cyclase family protein n=1 Tax=uncultured Arthrobacter sp. TaxID=114050 RepID=UPI0026258C15|nr:cyclase family protein [uncultured Arthrobacter sp.]